MGIEVKVDVSMATAQLKKAFRGLTDAELNKGVARALNDTVKIGKTRINRVIRETYGETAFTLSGLNKSISIIKATSGVPIAMITISGKKIPLKFFRPKKEGGDGPPSRELPRPKRGISIEIIKGQRMLIPGTFFGPKKHVFARGKYSKRPQFDFRHQRVKSLGNDLPITSMVGISAPQTFMRDSQETVLKVGKELKEYYPARLKSILTHLSTPGLTRI